MKKLKQNIIISSIFLKILLSLSILSFLGINTISNTHAVCGVNNSSTPPTNGIEVIVTECIPGAHCIGPDNKELYTCTIEKGITPILNMTQIIIKYFTYIASLGAVLFIVINGILYSMGGADTSMKDEAKKRIVGTLIGLIILLLSGVILNLIAPWVYI